MYGIEKNDSGHCFFSQHDLIIPKRKNICVDECFSIAYTHNICYNERM